MEENRQIMRALATAMNRIDQMYCDDVTRIGVKASELWLLYALDDGAPRQVLRPIYGAEDAALQATLDRYGPAVVAALVEAVDYFGRCLRDSFAKQMEEKENDDNP